MTTYARIIGGYAVDVCVTPPELGVRFNPEWLARQTFVVVPDGTTHGAIDNGDGTFTNQPPPPPPQPPEPQISEATKAQALLTALAVKLGIDPAQVISDAMNAAES